MAHEIQKTKQAPRECCGKWTSADEQRQIIDAIKVSTFCIRYLKVLTGTEEAYHGEALITFAERSRQIQIQVNELLAEQEKINDEFLNGDAKIAELEKSIEKLYEKSNQSRIDTKLKKTRVKRAATLTEQLKDLEEALKEEGFSMEDLENNAVCDEEEKLYNESQRETIKNRDAEIEDEILDL